jgi:hypothetical protein
MKCQTTKLNLSKIALILLFGSLISNTFCIENSKGLAKVRILKNEADAKELAKYTSNPIIVNRIERASTGQNRDVFFPHNIQRQNQNQQIFSQPATCGCANMVRCPPCGVVLFKEESIDCPCAPRPKCPVCPPLSLIHELAAKKAKQDQKIIYNLRGYTNNINKYLDSINKYSTDIVKFEMKAKEMSQKMEEAGFKAQNARMNMIKVI